jgi:hypothetical protein
MIQCITCGKTLHNEFFWRPDERIAWTLRTCDPWTGHGFPASGEYCCAIVEPNDRGFMLDHRPCDDTRDDSQAGRDARA